MKINEITLNPQKVIPGDPLRFRVGQAVVEEGHVVEKINYHPATRLFNKGLEVGISCYAVYFAGIPERRLVAEETVTTVEAVKEETKKNANTEAAVALPE